jgi:hypothetical protein
MVTACSLAMAVCTGFTILALRKYATISRRYFVKHLLHINVNNMAIVQNFLEVISDSFQVIEVWISKNYGQRQLIY